MGAQIAKAREATASGKPTLDSTVSMKHNGTLTLEPAHGLNRAGNGQFTL
jgi:hypothetical protein